MTHTVRLTGDYSRAQAKRLIDDAPRGWVVKIAAETRRDAQNRKMHPMIEDMRKQIPGMAAFTRDEVKLRFLNALSKEAKFLPELDGEGFFPIGQRSSTLTVSQFSALIEIMYEFGARHGVRWSDERAVA